MNRSTLLLSALGGVLLLALYYLFLWQPKSDEIASVEAEIQSTVDQQVAAQAQIEALEDVRARAPELEAQLAAAAGVIPSDAALPSAVRQLQLAADDSGVELLSIQPGPPQQLLEASAPLASIELGMSLEGGYFQILDFLRRLEDPAITSRGLTWSGLAVAYDEQSYPTLQTELTGRMFAAIDEPVAAAGEAGEAAAGSSDAPSGVSEPPDEAGDEAETGDEVAEGEDQNVTVEVEG